MHSQSAERAAGNGSSKGSHRLIFVSGMKHRGGGSGPNWPSLQSQLKVWVEDGIAPERIEAVHHESGDAAGAISFTRPLCH
ncbi:MAG: tannase/feruloyl esterase family alpha/beta hydrolase [Paracoccus sp. (in: a-proteobacteria)]|uniref:tannase/feruloyl esterase family alpha/beta hydrolase n=1 Tax=Paracoccus sp. TaxID=267 RepID=UPI0040591B3E